LPDMKPQNNELLKAYLRPRGRVELAEPYLSGVSGLTLLILGEKGVPG